ncbi:hypothetical protein ACFY1J_05510 [Streptomyces sp. NPDC001406]|uniref:hypothetical protein n=1 Tax=Streptomyces sp. NPDC001406 TaxID=3364572 RepID=UPI0036864EC8
MATVTAAPTLAVTDVTVTTDNMGRAYAVIPDAVARPLAVAALQGIDPNARGIFFESDAHPADSWVATTVRTIFDAVLASPVAAEVDHAHGLWLYRKFDGGTFYGFIVGESGWDADARWWRDYPQAGDLRVRGCASIASKDRRALAGTCTF